MAERKGFLLFRRSIYVSSDISEERLSVLPIFKLFVLVMEHLLISLHQLLGRRARRAYTRGTPLNFDQLL